MLQISEWKNIFRVAILEKHDVYSQQKFLLLNLILYLSKNIMLAWSVVNFNKTKRRILDAGID
jgi:hypothetical protein